MHREIYHHGGIDFHYDGGFTIWLLRSWEDVVVYSEDGQKLWRWFYHCPLHLVNTVLLSNAQNFYDTIEISVFLADHHGGFIWADEIDGAGDGHIAHFGHRSVHCRGRVADWLLCPGCCGCGLIPLGTSSLSRIEFF